MNHIEAMKQALDDICGAKLCEINSMSSRHEMIRLMDNAITTIRAELAKPEQAERQQALDKKADNARELGLDYEPEQEPVTWGKLTQLAQSIVEEKYLFKRFIDGTPLANDIACWMADFALVYTAPPRKEWVGLTDEEIVAVNKEEGTCWEVPDSLAITVAKAIEAKLRSKNDGSV